VRANVTVSGVAMVGARSGSLLTNLLLRNVANWGYTGEVWPVSRSERAVNGIPALGSLADLPSVPEAVFLAVWFRGQSRFRLFSTAGIGTRRGWPGTRC
jgi:acyl-CoA synthetase (NDP forming)